MASSTNDVMRGIKESPPAVAGVSVHLISGSLAGLASAVLLQPLDLLKTRLQQEQVNTKQVVRTSITNELKKLTQLKDLWRGTLPSAIRTLVGAGLYFTLLSKTRELWAKQQGIIRENSNATLALPVLLHMDNLIIGSITRGIVGLLTMPITVIKTRFESNMYNYSSMSDGIKEIYRDLGNSSNPRSLARNFFRGSVATLARDCPYAGLYVLFYEGFKNDVLPLLLPRDPTLDYQAGLINSAAAVLASTVATTLTAPFDAIKTRVQLSNLTSIGETTVRILREKGGVRNLFSGLSLRLARKGISAGISWCIYEELIKLGRQKNKRLW